MPKLNLLRFWPSSNPDRGSAGKFHAQSGQVIIEYVLLLVVTLAMAAIVMRMVVSRSPDDPGFLMVRWNALLNQISADDPNTSVTPKK